jgi:hypothetical protein
LFSYSEGRSTVIVSGTSSGMSSGAVTEVIVHGGS